ncbi:MAG TPA: hypothetical protein VJB09_00385 [Candidatus Paceibacterota bacterium]
MALDDKDRLSKIEDLKSKLFSRGYTPRIEHYDTHRHRTDTPPETWSHEDLKKEKPSMKISAFKKFFIFSLIFFGLSTLYVLFNFFEGGNNVSNDNIEISVLGNAFTNGGEDLPLIVEISNRNNVALELVDLVVESPRGAGSGNNNTERQRISLGSIPSGGSRSENVIVRLFGEQGSVNSVRISIEYRVPGSNAIFVKEKPYEVTIESTPLNLTIEAPSEVPPNQDVTLKIKAQINSERRAENMIIKVDYPLGFQFTSATPGPSLGNNVFELGTLEPGTEYQIAILGKMVDVWNGEQKTFKVWSGSQSRTEKSEIDVVFNSLLYTMLINKPFVESSIFVNGVYSKEYAINSGAPLSGEVRWANNLDTKVNDMEIRLKLSGNAMNRKSIKAPKGFYNSIEDTIVWDKNTDPSFAEVEPGESGLVSFSVASKQLYSSADGILNQPIINLYASISGKQAVASNVAKKIESNETKIVKIISDVGFANKILYYTGPFTNTGPIPPKVENETTYTVVWNVTNTANVVRNAKVRATLPSWVNFVGTISPADANLTYNASTKEIVWNVGTLVRGAGLGNAGPEVAFQITFTPSLSQLDETPIVINDAVLTGHDDFANVDVRVNRSSLNTKLPSDASFDYKNARVVE